jgi:hypothetical protein
VARLDQFRLQPVMPGALAEIASRRGVSGSMQRQLKKFQAVKKLSSVHKMKFFAISTLLVVAG